MMANTQCLFQCGNSLKCFLDTIFQQSPHTQNARLAADFLGWCPVKGHLPNAATQPEHLENAEPTSVACVVAVVAASPSHETGVGRLIRRNARGPQLSGRRIVRLLTFCAGYPNQPLSHNSDNTTSNEERLNADIGKPRNSTRRIVRM